MKILFSIFSIFLFSFSAVAAEGAKGQDSSQKINFSSVLEIKHIYNIDRKDILEVNIINRFISSSKIGGSVSAKINDNFSRVMGGITFFPEEWCLFDVGIGILYDGYGNEKKFLAGVRLWLGKKEILDFWLNGEGGNATPFRGEAILMVNISDWALGGVMANTVFGYGPRIEIEILPPLKIWGSVTAADWRWYWPEFYAHVGVKVIF